MATRDWNTWPAQEPSVDFADKALSAMMKSGQRASSPSSSRRWIAGLALAAMLAAAGAWGMVEVRKSREPKLPAAAPWPVAASMETVVPKRPRVQVVLAAPSASQPAPSATVSPSTPPRPKPSASGPAPVPSATATAPDKKIRTPSCECAPSEGFCTCVE